MADDTAPDPASFSVGDRVSIAGEVREIGEESLKVRFQSGYGLWQYVWIKFRDVLKLDSTP